MNKRRREAPVGLGIDGRRRGRVSVLFDHTLWRDGGTVATGAATEAGRRLRHAGTPGPHGATTTLLDDSSTRREPAPWR